MNNCIPSDIKPKLKEIDSSCEIALTHYGVFIKFNILSSSSTLFLITFFNGKSTLLVLIISSCYMVYKWNR